MVRSLKVGHYSEEVFMGPLIDESSVERYLKVVGTAEKEGAAPLIRGSRIKYRYRGNYVSPSIYQFGRIDAKFVERSYYLQNELFAPNLAVIPVRSSDEAIQMMNATQYGLAASIFSKNYDLYKEMSYDLEFGIVNWNKSTAGASSRLPFGGLKKSGNHFPTALSASRYCSYPRSSLEAEKPVIPEKLPPGFSF
jgi:succinylglutamic semialdehyde dehydrogenase